MTIRNTMSRDLTRAADLGRALPLAVGAALMTAAPAAAQLVTPFPIPAPPPASAGVAPITIADGLTLKPLADLRIRYENVHQDGIAKDADAVTARLRPGVELATRSGFSALVEAEGTLPIDPDYNSSTNGRTAYAGVSDPRNVELNRAQVQYRSKAVTITAGRQLIALDDQRFVGPAAWRQNEQTFDAVRVEAKAIGPFFADVAYSWSDRTIYGITADKLPATSTVKQAIGGDNVFAGAGVKLGPLTAKGFAYLVDQDAPGRQ
ncbi:MAG: alginate export family protein, partial [Janthinobacterium lividum]